MTTHSVTGQHFFFRWPQPPYLDTASECVTVYTQPHTEAVQPDRSEKIPLLIPSNPGELTEAVRMSEAEIQAIWSAKDTPLQQSKLSAFGMDRIRAVEQATAARLGVKMGDA